MIEKEGILELIDEVLSYSKRLEEHMENASRLKDSLNRFLDEVRLNDETDDEFPFEFAHVLPTDSIEEIEYHIIILIGSISRETVGKDPKSRFTRSLNREIRLLKLAGKRINAIKSRELKK